MARPIALVTGASSGIGQALAAGLAARGHDLVLVARSTAGLRAVATDLASAHGAASEVLAADLTAPQGVAAVAARIGADPVVDTVVNNAGFGSYGPFWELPVDSEVGQVELNVAALVALSHAALAAMVPRRAGRLLNVSSTAGFQPGPWSATYAATKAFVTSFTEAVHEEAAPHGVHVTALCPGFTRTHFHQRANARASGLPALMWADASSVAEAGLRALERNRAVCVPGLLNRLAAGPGRLAPRSTVRKMSGRVIGRLVDRSVTPGPG